MQRSTDGGFTFSPQDLIAYLEGDFAAWCERKRAERGTGHTGAGESDAIEPDIADEEMLLVMKRGIAHEAAHLETLRQGGLSLLEIARTADAFDATTKGMRDGAAIIYQGELRARSWMGIADFLHRVEHASSLGEYSYEPWDTKLAKTAKPYFLLQLCAYAEMLDGMQALRPERMGFVLGDGSKITFRTDDVWHYYARLKTSFERFQREWNSSRRPDPSLDRSHGRWTALAERILSDADDLSLVAGITRSQIIRLTDAGIDTVSKLAASANLVVPRMNSTTFANLHAQAEQQMATRTFGTVQWKLRATDPERTRRGLALLPPPSPNDVFFDIEGFPYAIGGLEYLLGVVTVENGQPEFRDWWAHDDVQEKRAFEQFIDWVHARWRSDPSMHIYHYAAYERTAMCRLMSKHGTRESETDELLRNHVLVDLYNVVHQGLVVGTPSYSLKDVEHLYMPPRDGGVTSAGGSVVEYQRWLDAGEPEEPQHSPILHGIRSYNKVDCESTADLRDWLVARQTEAGIAWIAPDDSNAKAQELAPVSPAEELAGTLLAQADAEEEGSELQRITRLLAWLLQFHRREEKPWWWKHFDRMDAPDAKLYDDVECLAGLTRTATPSRAIKKSTGFEYEFDPNQDARIKLDSDYAIPGTDKKCKIERVIDRDAGLVELKVGPGKSLPSSLSLVPADPVRAKPIPESIFAFVTQWITAPDCSRAVSDLLYRRPPRFGEDADVLASSSEDASAQALKATLQLDHSTLCIQGPPGTGKTTAAAEIIRTLVANGKRVGVVANGHQVILNLFERIAARSDELETPCVLVKVGGEANETLILSGRCAHIESKDAASAIATGPLVIGGTAWVFARMELRSTLDYLFIEEAGQFSLANAVAVGPSANNLILLGDQMQLAQPTQGSHPGESGLSALEYLLHGHATVPPDRGIFLNRSYRMHPAICSMISDSYYDGRLESAPSTHANRIIGAAGTVIGIESGIRFIPVSHAGCTQGSDEEVDAIAGLVAALLACQVVVKDKPARPMTLDDILIVAPFNTQVLTLKKRLGATACVGSVDKFQGREAPVVILSMCASTLDDAPRGPEFLFSRNRLNVAISRAQALAIVVGSPQLGDVRVRSVEEMHLVSGWCRIEGFVA